MADFARTHIPAGPAINFGNVIISGDIHDIPLSKGETLFATNRADRLPALFLLCNLLASQLAPLFLFSAHASTTPLGC